MTGPAAPPPAEAVSVGPSLPGGALSGEPGAITTGSTPGGVVPSLLARVGASATGVAVAATAAPMTAESTSDTALSLAVEIVGAPGRSRVPAPSWRNAVGATGEVAPTSPGCNAIKPARSAAASATARCLRIILPQYAERRPVRASPPFRAIPCRMNAASSSSAGVQHCAAVYLPLAVKETPSSPAFHA